MMKRKRDVAWVEHRRYCMHGVREGVDSHECEACLTIAKEMGEDLSKGQTYLYRGDPRVRAVALALLD